MPLYSFTFVATAQRYRYTIDADSWTDTVARFGRKLGKRFTLDGQHGPAPRVVDEKTGFDAHRGICAIAVFDASE